MQRQFPQAALALAVLAGSFQVPAASHHAEGILAQARQAIGGEARLRAVRSLSLKGRAETDREMATPVGTNLQIDVLLPDRFLISRDWPLSFFRRVGGFIGNTLIERRLSSGLWADVPFGNGSNEARASQMAARQRECGRYLAAWLLMAPEQYAVEFTDHAGGDPGDRQMDSVDAKGANGLAARLFFDKGTHRLLKLTYREPSPGAPTTRPAPGPPPAAAPGEPLFKGLEAPEAGADEVSMQFDDHRTDDGILFPHTIRIQAEGLHEVWKLSKFKVNPPLDAKYFNERTGTR